MRARGWGACWGGRWRTSALPTPSAASWGEASSGSPTWRRTRPRAAATPASPSPRGSSRTRTTSRTCAGRCRSCTTSPATATSSSSGAPTRTATRSTSSWSSPPTLAVRPRLLGSSPAFVAVRDPFSLPCSGLTALVLLVLYSLVMARGRPLFFSYFGENQHVRLSSTPVILVDDPKVPLIHTCLNRFKGTLNGRGRHRTRTCFSLRCIIASGDDDVIDHFRNDTTYHRFTEILGSWSFGDYFKEEAIGLLFSLLSKEYKLPQSRIYATYFSGDTSSCLSSDNESTNTLQKYIEEERIVPSMSKDDFWMTGETGPCGPCIGFFFDCSDSQDGVGSVKNITDEKIIEICRLVFVEFNRQANGVLGPLQTKHVLTGINLESLAAILQNKESHYDLDVYADVLSNIYYCAGPGIEDYSGKIGAADTDGVDTADRLLADHIRMIAVTNAPGSQLDLWMTNMDMGSMGKGQIWINGQSIGRYWTAYANGDCKACSYTGTFRAPKCQAGCGQPTQRWYHVPRSWLQSTRNLLVVFEELGGDSSKIAVVKRSVSSVCADVSEYHPNIRNWQIESYREPEYHRPLVHLRCALGQSISAIKFASFGTPLGTCGNFQQGDCHSANSHTVLEKKCIGQQRCVVTISPNNFGGDPCPNVMKRVAVEAVCSPGA